MRILLDCRELSAGPPNSEKRLLVLTSTALLAKKRGIEWLFLVDKAHPGGWPDDSGLLLPVSRGMPGAIGRKLWAGWRMPRILKKYRPDRVMPVEEIVVTPGAADDRYTPLGNEGKEAVKQRDAGGKEYFLAGIAGAEPEEVVDLLKAFSIFKKRQRCNIQLVLGRDRSGDAGGDRKGFDLAAKLATYKYRSDVHINDSSGEEWRGMVAASYAFISPFVKDNLGLSIFNAWKAETPVIAIDATSLHERGGDAALYARGGDPASLAAQLMSLYTNENLRAGLIGKGRDRLRSFGWDQSTELVWQGILRAINQ